MKRKIFDVVGVILLVICVIGVIMIVFNLLKPLTIECKERGGTYSIVPPMCNISNEQSKLDELERRIEELEKIIENKNDVE